ncbi:unnamed protein product [Linum trigynum]|uniref:Prp31 C-terminal domain-containing protein n=1 Tax=Linum trigynum TaxID=586398 RepID=A0AAV2FNF4_9ROSI
MVKSKLRDTGRNWMPRSEFVRICGEVCSDPDEARRVARTLDESGTSSVGYGLGEGHGMLGQAGRKARVAARQSKPVAKKCRDSQFGSSGTTSGLTSSLAFTLVQGIELSNYKLTHINCAVESKVPT